MPDLHLKMYVTHLLLVSGCVIGYYIVTKFTCANSSIQTTTVISSIVIGYNIFVNSVMSILQIKTSAIKLSCVSNNFIIYYITFHTDAMNSATIILTYVSDKPLFVILFKVK